MDLITAIVKRIVQQKENLATQQKMKTSFSSLENTKKKLSFFSKIEKYSNIGIEFELPEK